MRVLERIYLAGPMTGLPEFNKAAFHAEAANLRSLGFEVLSPAELCDHTDKPWNYYMRVGLAALLRCDSIFLLEGWSASKGATIEHDLAQKLSMTVYIQGDFHEQFQRRY